MVAVTFHEVQFSLFWIDCAYLIRLKKKTCRIPIQQDPLTKNAGAAERSSKQARTGKNGVGALQDVSCLVQKGHCEDQRNGFFKQGWMVGLRQSNKKEVLKQKKDCERSLHFPSYKHDVQATLWEIRRIVWNNWIKFNAGAILTDEEVRQLTEASCEIYPMKWVDTDKNAHLQRYNDYVSVPVKYKSRLVGW